MRSPTGNSGGAPGYFGKVRRRPAEILTHEEIRATLDAVDGLLAKRDRAIILLLYHHAMRASEICDLQWSGYDLASQGLMFWRRKTRDWMAHRIHPEAEIPLLHYRETERLERGAYKNRIKRSHGPMFLSQKGARLTPNGVWRMVRKWMRKAGVKASKCRTHTFRHSKATHMLWTGADVTIVQRYLGHASPRTTAEAYLHPNNENMRVSAAADRLYGDAPP